MKENIWRMMYTLLRRIWGSTRLVDLFEKHFGHHSFGWSFQSPPCFAKTPLDNPRWFETPNRDGLIYCFLEKTLSANNTGPLQTPCFRLFQEHLAFVIVFLGCFQEC